MVNKCLNTAKKLLRERHNQRTIGTKMRRLFREVEENETRNRLNTKQETESKEKKRANQDLE